MTTQIQKIAKKFKRSLKIFTHCYSKTVLKALKQAKKDKIKFEVHLTEIRPKFLGRRMAKALAKEKIKVTIMPDLLGPTGIKECDLFLFGAESITPKKEIINKIGTITLLEQAKKYKIPAFCYTTSKKFNAKITKRQSQNHLWKNPPKNIKILNPGFEIIPKSLHKWQSPKEI